MTALVTTVDGWRATVRSVRWSTVVLPALAASGALVIGRVLAPSDPGRLAMVGEVGLGFSAVAVAFLADDPTLGAVPGSPVSSRSRMAARAALMVPVTVLGWVLVLAVYAWLTPAPAHLDIAGRAAVALGLGAAALGLAALSGRAAAVPSPGAAGIAAVFALEVMLLALPKRWLHHLPPAEVFWPVAIVAALLAVAWVTKEPARS